MRNKIINILFHRIINMLVSLSAALLLVFVLIYSLPGKQYYQVLNPNYDELLIRKMSAEQNISIVQEFIKFIEKLITGNLGSSIKYHENISTIIFEHLQVTFLLSITAFVLQFIISLLMAYFSIKHRGKIFDKFLDKSTSIIYSLPTIVIAPILIVVFSTLLKIFPSSGLSGFDDDSNFMQTIYFLSLPVFSLVISFIPEYYKYLVEILEDLSNKNFITYLSSLGISRLNIFFRHIVPNSLNTILSVVGVDLGFLLSGSLITEIIFSIPGFGRLTYESIWSKDYYLAVSCGIYGSFFFIFINFIVDILRVVNDKRALSSLR